MKKFMNDLKNFVDEMLEVIYLANKEFTYVADDKRCYVKAAPVKGKVGIATGGGSGDLPFFLGYVCEGMLDGAAVGGVFQSPSADQMLEVTKHIDQGAGVLCIYVYFTVDYHRFRYGKLTVLS